MSYHNITVQSDALLRRASAQLEKALGFRAKAAALEQDSAALQRRAEELKIDALLSHDLPSWEKAKRALNDPGLTLEELNQRYEDLKNFQRVELFVRSFRYYELGDKTLAARLEARGQQITRWLSSDLLPRLKEMERQKEEEADRARKEAAFDKILDAAKSA